MVVGKTFSFSKSTQHMYCQFMTSKNELEPKVLKNVHILHYLYRYYQTKSNNVIKTKIS